MKYTFIDLYAGLGGFHQALSRLGHECIYASEQNRVLREYYSKNFPDTPISEDVLAIDPESLPNFDVLCAGFPCQPFSRAGNRLGFNDPRGNHFFKLIEIIEKKRPRFIFLENVETLKRHDSGYTFNTIFTLLTRLNYRVQFQTLSPHEFNIPHHRRRLFIIAEDDSNGDGLQGFNFPSKIPFETDLDDFLIKNFEGIQGEDLTLSDQRRAAIDFWEEFIVNFPDPKQIPTFPIWSFEWGANYPYRDFYNGKLTPNQLIGFKGSFGQTITTNNVSINKLKDVIPRYAFNTSVGDIPSWKAKYIEQNRVFYLRFQEYIDSFLSKPEFYDLNFSDQKLEWNCQESSNSFQDKIIQFRPSGLRIKKSNWIPALNTINTQNVFIPKINRKLSILELLKFQGMNLKYFPDIQGTEYIPNGGKKALGNAVNVEIIELIAKNLLIK